MGPKHTWGHGLAKKTVKKRDRKSEGGGWDQKPGELLDESRQGAGGEGAKCKKQREGCKRVGALATSWKAGLEEKQRTMVYDKLRQGRQEKGRRARGKDRRPSNQDFRKLAWSPLLKEGEAGQRKTSQSYGQGYTLKDEKGDGLGRGPQGRL